jgi:hypothetical protein
MDQHLHIAQQPLLSGTPQEDGFAGPSVGKLLQHFSAIRICVPFKLYDFLNYNKKEQKTESITF